MAEVGKFRNADEHYNTLINILDKLTVYSQCKIGHKTKLTIQKTNSENERYTIRNVCHESKHSQYDDCNQINSSITLSQVSVSTCDEAQLYMSKNVKT